jgi:predicted lysophospholipase L1 biosynthesis ABC-type transport system permease subunit
LKDEVGSIVSGGSVKLRKAPVAVQVTLFLLLLIGAGPAHRIRRRSRHQARYRNRRRGARLVRIYRIKTLEKQLDCSSAFGLLATLLAAIGLYGVMAYLVARRMREIGIRMALGAAGGDLIWLVMKEVLILVAIGIGAALPLAFGLTGFVKAQLYGITPNDPLSIALATIGIAAVALTAGCVPARRATSVDPMRALRWD